MVVDLIFVEEPSEVADSDLADQFAVGGQAVASGDVDQFDGTEAFREFVGNGVGIDAVGMSIAVEAEGCDDGYDALAEEALDEFDVDSLDFAGLLVIDAFEDPEREGDDGVGGDSAEVVSAEAFEDFVGEAVGCG